jgi:pheromone shutdown protein TraB
LENIVPPTNSTVVAEVLVTPLEFAVAPKVDDSPFTQKEYSRVQTDYHVASVSELDLLMEKFRGRLVHCVVPWHPYCDIYLCGTLHVAKSSTDMVREAVRCIGPDFVVVEVCEARIDNLCEPEESAVNITFSGVVRNAIGERSFKQLAMGLLSWMQAKAAKGMDSQLGGELAAATKEGVRAGATIVLGDRLYAVTIQRIFDRLHFFEKIKLAGIMTWEVVTMSLTKLREYVHKSENEDDFVRSEIEKFGKHLPSVADVIINERDEYLAQTILETARVGVRSPVFGQHRRGRIVAVVGAGHLDGIQR